MKNMILNALGSATKNKQTKSKLQQKTEKLPCPPGQRANVGVIPLRCKKPLYNCFGNLAVPVNS